MASGRRSERDVRRVQTAGVRLMRDRAGVSLLEVIVTLAVLGVLTTVVGLAWQRENAPGDTADAASAVAAARRQALDSGATVTLKVEVNEAVHVITVTPDGRVRGAEALGFDPLAGRLLQTDSDAQTSDSWQRATVRPDSKE
jgi:prepilin-type N-terminal cleavage/methylation domain-containing protein